MKKIESALISVYNKENLIDIARKLTNYGVNIYSTGGTYRSIMDAGIKAIPVESVTSYPSILGGRVKTLHPKIFGGILGRRNNPDDLEEFRKFEIPPLDLVIVDLYPFEETVKETNDENEIIEKIDIGGISLIRAAAKNYKDVLIIASKEKYNDLLQLIEKKDGHTSLEDRRKFALHAFDVSSHYDTAIFNYFNADHHSGTLKISHSNAKQLRYGENPHQNGKFYGNPDDIFTQLHGKEISYNNLGDIESAIQLISEFDESTFVIIKHNNACGVASREKLADAWKSALAGDPVSAFGGVLITNRKIDKETASEINKLFFEIILAPEFENSALEMLKTKKNRIILQTRSFDLPEEQFRSLLNGVLKQDRDLKTESTDDLKTVTETEPAESEKQDLIFANKVVKHLKSNAIVVVKDKQLLGIGAGQTSRVDAVKQSIEKAKHYGFDLRGAVLASDAFFPFADSVETAYKEGIMNVIQPGGSVRDQESIDFCNEHGMGMVFTGTRHFKH